MKITQSRNKREGKYVGKYGSRHFRSYYAYRSRAASAFKAQVAFWGAEYLGLQPFIPVQAMVVA